MNTDELALELYRAERRVREIQAKLHRWASDDHDRRFDDLYNLVADPGFLLVAWDRVRGNKGARTAGVDGQTACHVESVQGVEVFLDRLRAELKDRSFRPIPVRERMIPKPGTTKRRRLGIPALRDRVVQGALKLVLEPIFEADFLPCSYGFRPGRRAHDAVAEVRHFASRSYEWIVEGDIKACFDEISHPALLDRIRVRIGDKRVVALVKAFLKAGILAEDGTLAETTAGTPQGGILSPVIANVALSVLDEHFVASRLDSRERAKRRNHGLPNYRLVRYADDWCLAVSGTREQAGALCADAAEALSAMGLRLSPEKTLITHIDEGLDFLGWRIQRHRKRGTAKHYVYNYPARKALRALMAKIKALCWQDTNLPLAVLLHRLNVMLRGWTAYFRYGCSSATFDYVRAYPVAARLRLVAPQAPEDDVEATPPPLHARRMVARRGKGGLIQPGWDRHPTLLLPGNQDPQPLADRCVNETTAQRGLRRAGCPANGHVRFGRRPEETHQWKHRQGASGRPHPIRSGPGPKAKKRYLHVACTNLLTYYFLGDRDLPSFRSFVYSDLHGTVLVHDRYQNYDKFGGVAHQLCTAHYPDTVVMPMREGARWRAGVPVLAVSA